MKKNGILFSIFVIIILSFSIYFLLPEKLNTTSHILVLDKGVSNDEYWLKVIDPNSFEKTVFKIKIDSINTWNLVNINEEYLATYEYRSIKKNVDLVEIEYTSKK